MMLYVYFSACYNVKTQFSAFGNGMEERKKSDFRDFKIFWLEDKIIWTFFVANLERMHCRKVRQIFFPVKMIYND